MDATADEVVDVSVAALEDATAVELAETPAGAAEDEWVGVSAAQSDATVD